MQWLFRDEPSQLHERDSSFAPCWLLREARTGKTTAKQKLTRSSHYFTATNTWVWRRGLLPDMVASERYALPKLVALSLPDKLQCCGFERRTYAVTWRKRKASERSGFFSECSGQWRLSLFVAYNSTLWKRGKVLKWDALRFLGAWESKESLEAYVFVAAR